MPCLPLCCTRWFHASLYVALVAASKDKHQRQENAITGLFLSSGRIFVTWFLQFKSSVVVWKLCARQPRGLHRCSHQSIAVLRKVQWSCHRRTPSGSRWLSVLFGESNMALAGSERAYRQHKTCKNNRWCYNCTGRRQHVKTPSFCGWKRPSFLTDALSELLTIDTPSCCCPPLPAMERPTRCCFRYTQVRHSLSVVLRSAHAPACPGNCIISCKLRWTCYKRCQRTIRRIIPCWHASTQHILCWICVRAGKEKPSCYLLRPLTNTCTRI